MTADKIMDEIRGALGNPSSGPLKDALPLIEVGVRKALGDKGDKGAKEARVIKAVETRKDD